MNQSQKNLPVVVTILALCGVIVSIISVYHFAGIYFGFQQAPSFCSLSATVDCDAVNRSQYALLFRIPIASLALFFYGGLFFFSLAVTGGKWLSETSTNRIYRFLSLFSVLFSLYLGSVAFLKLKVVCPTCVALYLINFIFLFVVLRALGPKGFFAEAGRGISESILLFTNKRRGGFLLALGIILGFYASVSLPGILGTLLTEPKSTSAIVEAYHQSPTFNFSVVPSGVLQDSVKGNPSSAIQVVEFADFECPACRKFSIEFSALAKKYGDKVLFVHKHFPLDNECNKFIPQKFHQFACVGAKMSRCALEQGKFWEMYEELFSLPELVSEVKGENVKQAMNSIPTRLNLDIPSFDACMASTRPQQKISSDIEEAMNAGLQGTPSVFINGKFLPDIAPESISAVLDSLLKK